MVFRPALALMIPSGSPTRRIGHTSLSGPARLAIEDRANETHISHATAWEVAIKLRLGKLKLNVSFDQLFPGVLLTNGFRTLIPDFANASH